MMTWLRPKAWLQSAALALPLTALLGSSAQATLLWYDGFSLSEYTADAELAGQSGGGTSGSFFTNPWIEPNYPEANSIVLGTGLDRPGLLSPAIGGAAGRVTNPGCCNEQRTSRVMSNPWGGFTDPDGTFYVSFLMDLGTGNAADPHHRVFEMHDSAFDDEPARTLQLGISSFTGVGNSLGLRVRDSTDNSQTSVTLAENADLADLAYQGTHFIVLKFEMSTSGNDTISAFLDPVGTTEPAPSASHSVGQFLADRMSAFVQFEYTGGTAGALDEIRVGTTFADVANNSLAFDPGPQVPEPTSLCLVGLGLASLACGARRRA